jgi:hypothetical protein
MYTFEYGERRLHYLAMPRTGSQATSSALRLLGARRKSTHHCLSDYATLVRPEDTVITTVRNPWDWFPSFWNLQQCPGKFNRFVRETCEKSKWLWRNPDCTRCELFWHYVPKATVVMRFETLHEDLTKVMKDFGHETIDLPVVGRQKDKFYRDYYDNPTIEYVRIRFKDELAKWGYKW